MARKARIEHGHVVELLTAEPFPEFHPALMWVDASAEVQIGWTYADGCFAAPEPPTAGAIAGGYLAALQEVMDLTARSHGYDDVKSAMSYMQSSIPKFAAEASAMCEWRDAVWRYGLEEMDLIRSGLKPLPALEEFVSAMPQIVWPQGVSLTA
ncbi:hypothetical protein ASL20_09610 [Cupriavidus necator]|uniref:hypothetical protein n=1 Tax=Cupriavidus necator TaxID=106590 RepID=UPI0007355462|nr:hypothetical protein [Cupriavidus necator]KUE88872.1 hypothetical protein ASL20_09610 [Cupriavidus necator]